MGVDQLRDQVHHRNDGERAEVHINRAVAPRYVPSHALMRYRWTVVYHQAVEGACRGVYDARFHLWTDSGYTITALGAYVAVGRAIRARAKQQGGSR
jgi:hypothetical protein